MVQLDDLKLGDMGNARVDARLLQAILVRDQKVAEWLRNRGVQIQSVEEAFPGSGWEEDQPPESPPPSPPESESRAIHEAIARGETPYFRGREVHVTHGQPGEEWTPYAPLPGPKAAAQRAAGRIRAKVRRIINRLKGRH